MPIALALTRGNLLTKCIEVIDSFEPKKTTVDAYVSDCEVFKDKRIGDVEQKFIHQVFYGCNRYQKFLKLFVTSFMYKCPTTAIRSDQTLYTVLGYMLFFRLEELGVEEFSQFFNSGLGTVSALLALLQYALSQEDLEKWVKVEWCKVYDVGYIEDDIIGKLQRYAEELKPLVQAVEFKTTGTCIQEVKKKTQPKPFNLTQPRPRLIPEPEVISREVKALPVPDIINKTSLAEVEETKKKRLEEHKTVVLDKYPTTHHFKLETANRRDGSELEELTKKVDAERMAECTFKPKQAKKYVQPSEEAVVKQNVAAVLREDALLRSKQAREAGILKNFECELHDASEYNSWQQKMKQKDHEEEEKRVRQRMVEMQLTREGAIEAHESEVRKKNIKAQHQKGELEADLQLKERENVIELENKQVLVKETQEERENARRAEEEVLKARAIRAEELRKDKEAEADRKRREDEQEMEKRKDLIRQIRALEKVPVERFKKFDAAEPPCQGLLEEMSLAELRERVRNETAKREKECEDKRERQLEKKLEKQNEFAEKAATLAKIREQAKDQQEAKHHAIKKRHAEIESAKERHREESIMEVAEKIQLKKQQKKEEEAKLKRELKEISTKRQFLCANAEMVEAKAHGEQHAGLQREARERQKRMLIEQRKKNEIKSKDVMILRENQQANAESYKVMQEAVNDRVRRAKAADSQLKEEILRCNSTARKLTAETGQTAHNKYIQRVNARSASPAPRMAVSA